MSAEQLEAMLVRLSLDGKNFAHVGGDRMFPILSFGGAVVYAMPKTVLVKDGRRRGFASQPGVAYFVAAPDGGPAGAFAGKQQRLGRNEVTAAAFVERFGDYFERNEIDVEEPADPFAAFMAA